MTSNPTIGLSSGGLSLKGHLKQSVNRGLLGAKFSLDELCQAVKALGVTAIDCASPEDWSTLNAYGLDCSLCYRGGISVEQGWGGVAYHDELVSRYVEHINIVADAGYQRLLCFSGNANGLDPAEGLANAEAGLKRILGHAEKRGVVLVMELLNTRVNHPDYLCSHSAWGVELCQRLSSPNFGLLYDIYHMQIMEGDLIATIRKHHEHFVYYHTAGVPTRGEIGDNQEINYPAVCRTILETGFQGYLAHEFFPTGPDPLAALREAILLCDV